MSQALPPTARPARCSATDLDRARAHRLRAEGTTLVLDGPQGRRTWPELLAVRWVDTARRAVQQGADPLRVDPGGHLELPDGDDVVRLRLFDWLPDPDLPASGDPFDPLEVSGVGPVLRSVGARVERVDRPRAGHERRGPGDRRFVLFGLLSLVWGVGVLLALALPEPASSWVAVVVAVDVLALAVLLRSEERPGSRSRRAWRPDDEVRPRPDGPRPRRFVRRVRLAAVGPELVVVDSAAGELWLGTEPVTGAAALVEVRCDGRPLRVDLRRQDGTVLARLPWEDWCAGDGGASLRDFARRHRLAEQLDERGTAPRDRSGAPPRLHFGAARRLPEAHEEAFLNAQGFRPPAAFIGGYAVLALIAGGGRDVPGVLVLVLAGAALALAVLPGAVRGARRRRSDRLVPAP